MRVARVCFDYSWLDAVKVIGVAYLLLLVCVCVPVCSTVCLFACCLYAINVSYNNYIDVLICSLFADGPAMESKRT